MLPSPLYIFGYGSLLWKPGDLLEELPSIPCTAFGWKRLFVQRSCDHRGTPIFPGLVASLVEENEMRIFDGKLTSRRLSRYLTSPSKCPGLVWVVPVSQAESLIAELDFREKGGYARHTIRIQLHADSPFHSKDEFADALVYTGNIINPLFDIDPHLIPSSKGSKEALHENSKNISPMNRAAEIISTAVGPSGPNVDYLLGLVRFLSENNFDDSYLQDLVHDVFLCLGPWRGRHLKKKHFSDKFYQSQISVEGGMGTGEPLKGSKKDSIAEKVYSCEHEVLSSVNAVNVVGWGSNEHFQLPCRTFWCSTVADPPPTSLGALGNSSKSASDGTIQLVDSEDLRPHAIPVDLPSEDVRYISLRQEPVEEFEFNMRSSLPSENRVPSHTPADTGHLGGDRNSSDLHTLDIEVLCGGSWSGRLEYGRLYLWGKGLHDLVNDDEQRGGQRGERDFHRSELVGKSDVLQCGHVQEQHKEQQSIQTVVIDGVAGCAMGYSHILLLLESGYVVCLGDNSHGQCGPDTSTVDIDGMNDDRPSLSSLPFVSLRSWRQMQRKSKISVQTIRSKDSRVDSELSEAAAAVAASAAASSAAADTAASATAAASPPIPKFEVIKLAAGLHHSAAVTSSGHLLTWGSSAHGQCVGGRDVNGVSMWSPPSGARVVEVSCGARHTVAVDDAGLIWTLGDNRFGTLGRPVVFGNTTGAGSTASGTASGTGTDTVSSTTTQEVHTNPANESAAHKTQRPQKLVDCTPGLVAGLDPTVRWQKVLSGWSHCIARGIRANGELQFAAWGRRDMGQIPSAVVPTHLSSVSSSGPTASYSSSSSAAAVNSDTPSVSSEDRGTWQLPNSLPTLPADRQLREVWCGSEFTVASDHLGCLWACGWNEHGNLGCGSYCAASFDWVPVMARTGSEEGLSRSALSSDGQDVAMKKNVGEGDSSTSPSATALVHVQLREVWEGAVACGGGHCLALSDPLPLPSLPSL